MSKHVIPVSPNSFYAYLMAIAYGLKSLKIEQEAKTIRGELLQVQEKFGKFFTNFGLVGKHLSNAVTKNSEQQNDNMTSLICLSTAAGRVPHPTYTYNICYLLQKVNYYAIN